MSDSALHDLTWLCTEYQSSIGMKSSLGTFEALALGVHVFGGGGHEMSQRALSAAWRAGKIIGALHNVGKQNLNVLIHAYDPPPRMPPSYVANYGGELAGIAWKLRPPKGVKGQQATKAWAKLRLDKAHDRYLLEKRKVQDER